MPNVADGGEPAGRYRAGHAGPAFEDPAPMATPAQQDSSAKPEPTALSVERAARGRAMVLSWLVSVAWHAALFTAMFVTAWLADLAGEQDDLPIARTELLGDLTETHLEIDFQAGTPLQTELAKPESLQLKPKRFEMQARTISAARPELSIVGIGTGGGDDFAKYGLRASAGGPGPDFFGIGRRARGARRIVYVVDRSGSMMTTFDAVRRELRKSVDGLRRSQKFHVIFFNAGPPLENRPKKLVPANGRQKERLFEFLDTIQAEGSTDPVPAMERAFEARPDLIYFLTDGDFNRALIDRLAVLNRDKRVRIFTIAYVSSGGRPLLEQIAREHQGEFKFVSEHEIY